MNKRLVAEPGIIEVPLSRAPAEPGEVIRHVLACKRQPVKKLLGMIPDRYLEALEQNQQIASCCRHPQDHDLEAWYSRPEEKVPDIYIFHCRCGRKHRRFCVGGDDARPFWEIR